MTIAQRSALAGVLALALYSPLAGAETVIYTGTGNVTSDEDQMPLANGSSVVTATSRGVAALSTSPPAVMDIRCTGMGVLRADDDYGMVYYCTLVDTRNRGDAFDIKGIETPDSNKVEIVGGSGRWQGATGAGTVEQLRSSGSTSAFTFTFEITTP